LKDPFLSIISGAAKKGAPFISYPVPVSPQDKYLAISRSIKTGSLFSSN